MVLAFLCDAYDEEVVDAEKNDTRVVLRLHPALAPFKAAVLPLSKKLSGKALEVHDTLARQFMVDFDDAGSIGKRYRREDEIGTPFCITYDFESENDGCVTVRDRDTMQQERIAIDELNAYIALQAGLLRKEGIAKLKILQCPLFIPRGVFAPPPLRRREKDIFPLIAFPHEIPERLTRIPRKSPKTASFAP